MRRVALVLVLLALVLVAALAFGGSAVMASSGKAFDLDGMKGVEDAFIQITYADPAGNPYCDGLDVVLDTTTGDWSIHGTQCGCLVEPAWGRLNYTVGGPPPPTGVGGGIAYMGAFDNLYTQLTFNPRGWAHYDSFGNMINSGIWLPGCPPPVDGGPTSLGR